MCPRPGWARPREVIHHHHLPTVSPVTRQQSPATTHTHTHTELHTLIDRKEKDKAGAGTSWSLQFIPFDAMQPGVHSEFTICNAADVVDKLNVLKLGNERIY